jgi:LysR family transcriptional regulator of gallate degradation
MMSSRQITRQVDAGLLAVLPVALRHPARRIGLTTRRDWLPTPAAASLLEAIRDACGGLGERARR